eukprot:TRINITY_DN2642_c0_g1_i6.p1 TRINITY_DN2642_c0_g1~~TRINITY_DN2642_c0_g1_i6.p1  ORF type:complete len:1552 (-),score=381.36 TRINITY_DN2642_c0_g1_i6:112-4767(-)
MIRRGNGGQDDDDDVIEVHEEDGESSADEDDDDDDDDDETDLLEGIRIESLSEDDLRVMLYATRDRANKIAAKRDMMMSMLMESEAAAEKEKQLRLAIDKVRTVESQQFTSKLKEVELKSRMEKEDIVNQLKELSEQVGDIHRLNENLEEEVQVQMKERQKALEEVERCVQAAAVLEAEVETLRHVQEVKEEERHAEVAQDSAIVEDIQNQLDMNKSRLDGVSRVVDDVARLVVSSLVADVRVELRHERDAMEQEKREAERATEEDRAIHALLNPKTDQDAKDQARTLVEGLLKDEVKRLEEERARTAKIKEALSDAQKRLTAAIQSHDTSRADLQALRNIITESQITITDLQAQIASINARSPPEAPYQRTRRPLPDSRDSSVFNSALSSSTLSSMTASSIMSPFSTPEVSPMPSPINSPAVSTISLQTRLAEDGYASTPSTPTLIATVEQTQTPIADIPSIPTPGPTPTSSAPPPLPSTSTSTSIDVPVSESAISSPAPLSPYLPPAPSDPDARPSRPIWPPPANPVPRQETPSSPNTGRVLRQANSMMQLSTSPVKQRPGMEVQRSETRVRSTTSPETPRNLERRSGSIFHKFVQPFTTQKAAGSALAQMKQDSPPSRPPVQRGVSVTGLNNSEHVPFTSLDGKFSWSVPVTAKTTIKEVRAYIAARLPETDKFIDICLERGEKRVPLSELDLVSRHVVSMGEPFPGVPLPPNAPSPPLEYKFIVDHRENDNHLRPWKRLHRQSVERENSAVSLILEERAAEKAAETEGTDQNQGGDITVESGLDHTQSWTLHVDPTTTAKEVCASLAVHFDSSTGPLSLFDKLGRKKRMLDHNEAVLKLKQSWGDKASMHKFVLETRQRDRTDSTSSVTSVPYSTVSSSASLSSVQETQPQARMARDALMADAPPPSTAAGGRTQSVIESPKRPSMSAKARESEANTSTSSIDLSSDDWVKCKSLVDPMTSWHVRVGPATTAKEVCQKLAKRIDEKFIAFDLYAMRGDKEKYALENEDVIRKILAGRPDLEFGLYYSETLHDDQKKEPKKEEVSTHNKKARRSFLNPFGTEKKSDSDLVSGLAPGPALGPGNSGSPSGQSLSTPPSPNIMTNDIVYGDASAEWYAKVPCSQLVLGITEARGRAWVGYVDCTMKVYTRENLDQVGNFRAVPGAASTTLTCMATFGTRVWVAHSDGTIRVWSSSKGKVAKETKLPNLGTVKAMIAVNKTVWLACGSHVVILQAKTLKPLKPPRQADSTVHCLVHVPSYSSSHSLPDQPTTQCVWVGTETDIQRWSVDSMQRMGRLSNSERGASSMCLANCSLPVGPTPQVPREVWSCAANLGVVYAWTADTGQCIKQVCSETGGGVKLLLPLISYPDLLLTVAHDRIAVYNQSNKEFVRDVAIPNPSVVSSIIEVQVQDKAYLWMAMHDMEDPEQESGDATKGVAPLMASMSAGSASLPSGSHRLSVSQSYSGPSRKSSVSFSKIPHSVMYIWSVDKLKGQSSSQSLRAHQTSYSLKQTWHSLAEVMSNLTLLSQASDPQAAYRAISVLDAMFNTPSSP